MCTSRVNRTRHRVKPKAGRVRLYLLLRLIFCPYRFCERNNEKRIRIAVMSFSPFTSPKTLAQCPLRAQRSITPHNHTQHFPLHFGIFPFLQYFGSFDRHWFIIIIMYMFVFVPLSSNIFLNTTPCKRRSGDRSLRENRRNRSLLNRVHWTTEVSVVRRVSVFDPSHGSHYNYYLPCTARRCSVGIACGKRFLPSGGRTHPVGSIGNNLPDRGLR